MAFGIKTTTMDMTRGPLFKKIILFTLPVIATNLLQVFYNMADVMVAGLSDNPDAMGAVGSTTAFVNMILYIFMGVSAGTDVVVARCVGAGDDEDTSRAVHTSICISLLFGLAGSVVGILLTRPVYTLMGYGGNLLILAERYTCILFGCLPFISLNNFLAAIMRSKGDTKTPLYVMSFTGLLNVLLNLFFVLVLHLTVEGVAIATVAANAVSAVLLWYFLSNDTGPCRLSFKKLRISLPHFRSICLIGLPAGIQNALISVSTMLLQSSIMTMNKRLAPAGSAYEPVIKGNTAAESIEGFAYSAIGSIVNSSIVFTGQNVGVGDYRRVRRVLIDICLFSAAAAVVIVGGLMLFREPLLALYGVSSGVDELSDLAFFTANKRIFCKWSFMVLFALMNTASGVLRGLGRSLSSAIIALIGMCGVRVVWILGVFNNFPSLDVIYFSFPISWTLTGVAFFIYVIAVLRKKIRNQAVEERIKLR
ncbi:MAG: MATE family efflux transporter [Clostridia bacterium]|nr:MATE family efflux transporter [Clostridia bacterium]